MSFLSDKMDDEVTIVCDSVHHKIDLEDLTPENLGKYGKSCLKYWCDS